MKTILVATDLSVRSDRAIERAMVLAKYHQADLHVAHIVDEALPDSITLHQKEVAEDKIRNHVISLAANDVPSIKIDVKIDNSSEGIIRHARNIQADLIILGVHDSAREDFFRGTTSERIIRMSEFPVLVVKEHSAADYQRIAIAVDFSIHSRRAIEFTLAMAPKAEIYLIHAYQIPFAGLMYGSDTHSQVREEEQKRMEHMISREMETFFRAMGVNPTDLQKKQILKCGEVRQVIGQEVDRLKPDLIALGTHGRTGIAHAFLGSVAEDILGKPPCDALAIKAW